MLPAWAPLAMLARFVVPGPSPKILTSFRPAAFNAAGRPVNALSVDWTTYFKFGFERSADKMLSGAFWMSANPTSSFWYGQSEHIALNCFSNPVANAERIG